MMTDPPFSRIWGMDLKGRDMTVKVEKQRQKLEDVAEHIRAMCPEHTWKVLSSEDKNGTFVLLRGVSGDQEPKLEDRFCLDLFANGEVVVCNMTPELIGRISMRGKAETLAKRFYELLADAFEEDAEGGCDGDCANCGGKVEIDESDGRRLLHEALAALKTQPLWVDFSAEREVH
jgi:hypothetical protein